MISEEIDPREQWVVITTSSEKEHIGKVARVLYENPSKYFIVLVWTKSLKEPEKRTIVSRRGMILFENLDKAMEYSYRFKAFK